jgi:hypothetical protein
MIRICAVIFMCLIKPTIFTAQPVANELVPRVDDRVEFMSIVYILARPNKIDDKLNIRYSKSISDHFHKYAEHSFIRYFSSLLDSLKRRGKEQGYRDVWALATHLTHPPNFQPIVPLNEVSSDGWDSRLLLTSNLIAGLRQFYEDSRGAAFLEQQRRYYASVDRAYVKQGARLNRTWFESFFGIKTTEDYFAIISLCSNDAAYLRVNYGESRRDTFTVFGCATVDADGIPRTFFGSSFSSTMLHEYLHAFSNQLVDANLSMLQRPAEALLSNLKVYDLMKGTFYGNWNYLLYESLVRACEIRYLIANEVDVRLAENAMIEQEKAGFFWIRGLVDKLGSYERSRDDYRDLSAFMPEVIQYFTAAAADLGTK